MGGKFLAKIVPWRVGLFVIVLVLGFGSQAWAQMPPPTSVTVGCGDSSGYTYS